MTGQANEKGLETIGQKFLGFRKEMNSMKQVLRLSRKCKKTRGVMTTGRNDRRL